MSHIADRIKTSQDKDGMLRRALERIIQLYTDKSHFIYELLQNAEDAEAKSIRFVQYSDRLEVFHDGKPFTSENLQGLCDIGKSDKIDNLNQIGEFGVGFKSVFGICETVRLYSEPSNYRNLDIGNAVPFAVEIVDFTRPEDIQEEVLEGKYTTRFVFPYTVGKTFSGFTSIEELINALSKKLQNLGITTLLFMKNLELIEYKICISDDTIEGQYLLEKTVINDHCQFVSAIGETLAGNEENISDIVSYMKFSRPIDNNSLRTVDIAFPVVARDDGSYEYRKSEDPFVSVYFPTETESKLDFIIQGPYRTTPNRSSIPADEKDNQRLADETAILLKDSILELKKSGMLNMSLVKLLPVYSKRFDTFKLFLPLYETIKTLFITEEVIPTKNRDYVRARFAKIVRQEKLAQLLDDDLLSRLIKDGNQYHWLPTMLTETNREYEHVYRFFNGDLKIGVIRPEDLRVFFASNPGFLPSMSDDWLVELYGIFENVGAVFSKSKNEINMLTSDIVKTSKGTFVAPYRRTESKQYIPNVFIPSKNITSDEINFVDPVLYTRCRYFFDNILQIQKPNEYEFIINDIKKKYSEASDFAEEKHIEDFKNIARYLKYDEYRDEVKQIIKEIFVLRCTDNKFRNPFSCMMYLRVNEDNINIEEYYRNITNVIFYIDADFYALHDVTIKDLVEFGVRFSILTGDDITQGTYDNGSRGRQPEWWTPGEFRWKLSLDSIKEVLIYISTHPTAKDSIMKSIAIYKTLLLNESKLIGSVKISGNTPNLENETCELIKVLKGERISGWNGKWLYTDSGELVSQKTVSKHDISIAFYGKINPDSAVYDLLGFKKTEADEVDDLKKMIPQKQLDAFFENELKQRFGISSAELTETFGINRIFDRDSDDSDDVFPFPISKVKNWETLRKHAAEMLLYADPVTYEYAVRRIRTSNHDKEAKAYLHGMYRYDGVYRFACQMCHEATANIERAQIFNDAAVELDPMNLCLCPNCAAEYRQIRNSNNNVMQSFRRMILETKESDVLNGEQVVIPLEDKEIWFTQTHFAEVQELLKLSDEVKKGKEVVRVDVNADEEYEKSGLSVYSNLIGKMVKRKDGFVGVITDVDDEYIHVNVIQGKNAGDTTKIQLSFILQHDSVYEFGE